MYTQYKEKLETSQEASGIKGKLRNKLKSLPNANRPVEFNDVMDLEDNEVMHSLLLTLQFVVEHVLLNLLFHVHAHSHTGNVSE